MTPNLFGTPGAGAASQPNRLLALGSGLPQGSAQPMGRGPGAGPMPMVPNVGNPLMGLHPTMPQMPQVPQQPPPSQPNGVGPPAQPPFPAARPMQPLPSAPIGQPQPPPATAQMQPAIGSVYAPQPAQPAGDAAMGQFNTYNRLY